mgnify:CR=1 FL=1
MVRILVADDERQEREALQFIAGQVSDLETEVILASNGREAVDLARRMHPDIAFLDIKMPILSGIEAARQIRRADPDIRIVFLTAFDHFDYAQEAIRLRADDFIIKPADNDRIVEVIRALASAGGGRRGDADGVDAAVLAEAKLVADTVLGNADEPLLRRFLGLPADVAVSTMAAVIRVGSDGSSEADGRQYDRELKRRMLSAVREEAQSEGISVLGSIEQSVLYILLAVPGQRALASVSLTLEQALDRALGRIEEEFGVTARAGADPPASGFQRLGLRFANAKIAARAPHEPAAGSPDRPGARVRRYQAGGAPDAGSRRELLDAERKMLQCILGDNADERSAAADRLVSALYRLSEEAAVRETEAAQSVAYLTHATAMLVGSVPEPADGAGDGSTDAGGDSHDALAATMREAVSRLASHARRSSEHTHRAVKGAKRIMENRFCEDLSLEAIASEVGLSAFHLSRIFKTATGSTVLDFLTTVRMEEARRLMRETSLSIKEISARVGYNDQNYFSRVFRRLTGTTPSAFRRAWQ